MIEPNEIDLLNEARRALSVIANRARMDYDSQASGMIYGLAERNEHELFILLNYFQNYAHGAIRDDQVVLDR